MAHFRKLRPLVTYKQKAFFPAVKEQSDDFTQKYEFVQFKSMALNATDILS